MIKEVKREFDNILDFKKTYGFKYPRNALSNCYSSEMSTTIQQMYYAANIYEYNDIYAILVNTMQELAFDIECNVLDVASGYYPALGYEIAGRQLQLNKGTLTCIDPNLVCDKPFHKNVKLVKDNFTEKYDLSHYDLIVSSTPCTISRELFNSVMKAKKNFFIYPCNCFTYNPDNATGYLWVELFEICKEYERENKIENRTKIKFFNNPYSTRPVIYKNNL